MGFSLSGEMFWIVVALAVWSIPFKAWALWLSARRGEKAWFIALILLNTAAILELVYIFFVAKRSDTK